MYIYRGKVASCVWDFVGLARRRPQPINPFDQPANQLPISLPTRGRGARRVESSSRAPGIRGAAPVGANLITVGRGRSPKPVRRPCNRS